MTAPQEIRFCTTSDGVRIAFASVGDGPPLVCTTAWLTHLEHDLQSPFLGPWLRRLARHFRVVRYDGRGNGLSQRDIDGMSVDAWVRDLEAVADAARLERFPIYGLSQGAVVAVAYASRHPDRVERMLLHGGCARGRSLALARPQGRLVRCDRGCIWLTHDGDPRDIVLAAGEAHRCDRDAPLIVHALDDARVYVEPPPGRGGRREATCP